jgi:adenine-specific DNA-methyltransferase
LPLFRALDDERQRRLAKRIEELDRAIDAAVYQLYGLTEEEIRVVEGKA